MSLCTRLASAPLVAGLLILAPIATWGAGEPSALVDPAIAVEWNSSNGETRIQIAWDRLPWRRMTVRNGVETVLDAGTDASSSGQPFFVGGAFEVAAPPATSASGLPGGSVESVATPPASTASLANGSSTTTAALLARFPEGTYAFQGLTLEGVELLGSAELTHVLPAPPVTSQAFKVILPPARTTVAVPTEFLEPEAEYAVEVVAVHEGGNRTITESGTFTTDVGP